MKKAAEVKYPNSANLFQFCRRVLDHKFGGIRVIDQDVGQILGFDPADCSHWKKGKKNIRSIQAMKNIAEHLGVDEKLVVDVASGEIDETEAFHEYSGYGSFDVDQKVIETAKKEFYRRHAGSWSKEKETEFKEYFEINSTAIDSVVRSIHEKINFTEAPLYLPEVFTSDNALTLDAVESTENKEPIIIEQTDDKIAIKYTAGMEMKPYMRYLIAKGLARHYLKDFAPKRGDLSDYAKHLIDVQGNLFSAKLLAPATLIRKEMAQLNVAKDVVSQLAEIFWVSKTFMNRRLKEILQNQPTL